VLCFDRDQPECLFIDPKDVGELFSPKRRLALNGLHAVMSHKLELFTNYILLRIATVFPNFEDEIISKDSLRIAMERD
jgi:hypothetical protein